MIKWYDVNVHAGRRQIIGGFITVLAALLSFLSPNLSPAAYMLICGSISAFAISLCLVQTTRHLNQQ